MKSLFWMLILTIGIVMAPVVAAGQDYQTAGANFPISQPLVREGTFATDLAAALKLGSVTDEAQAESLLSSAGIMPKNGWIADYPVTPDIVGELQDAVVQASGSGYVHVAQDDAVSAFQSVVYKYGLAVREDTQTEPADVSSAPQCSPGQDVNDYYNTEGPPVVTYCAPPEAYGYLYSWVSYPFWWSNFWFPGFFVLVDFDTVVVVHHHHRHFSNHFFDRKSGRFERVVAADRLSWNSSKVGGTALSGVSTTQRTQAVTTGMKAVTTSRSAFMSRQTAGTQPHATAGSVARHSAPLPATGRMGTASPFVRGGAATHWGGGHSFAGFSGSGFHR